MDNKSDFEVMCDKYKSRLAVLENKLSAECEGYNRLTLEKLCLARSGHKFVSKGEKDCRYEECEYCGWRNDL